MLFTCKVCAEKDERIEDLKNQIQFLRAMLAPREDVSVSAQQLEADAVLSAQQHIVNIPLTQEQLIQAEEERRERDRLLSGTY